MSTKLFEQIIFGPIISRRLGVSLGVNLLPEKGKICTFDCIYCECGYNEERKNSSRLPKQEEVKRALSEKLDELKKNGNPPDVITFAGNGEPTLHLEFEAIIDDTICLRNKYFPNCKISVLSNSTRIDKDSVFRALLKVDNNILKLDSVFPETLQLMNQPVSSDFTIEKLIDDLCRFEGKLIIQTMFLRGFHQGKKVDNTTEEEVNGWLSAMLKIKPQQIMIYTIDRDTPEKELIKLSKKELEAIALKAESAGFSVSVSV